MSEIKKTLTNEELDAATNNLFDRPSQTNETVEEVLAELDFAESGGQTEGDSES